MTSAPPGARDVSTVTAAPERAPLRIVPGRRRAAGLVTTALVLLLGVMLVVSVFHTRLAQRQLDIDRLERATAAARERYDELRRERAELRSPARLAAEAGELGMQPGSVSEFVAVPPDVVAAVVAAMGLSDVGDQIRLNDGPLDQFRRVKAVSEDLP